METPIYFMFQHPYVTPFIIQCLKQSSKDQEKSFKYRQSSIILLGTRALKLLSKRREARRSSRKKILQQS